MRRRGALVALVALAVGLLVRGTAPFAAAAAERDEVRILAGEPATFDPAGQGDITTAAVTAQIHETLTIYDAARQIQPALASSWDVAADGREVVFHLRPGLTFSDGTALTAEDVVGSWLRLIDPDSPSPLAALMIDVKGARAHLLRQSTDPAEVGLRASDLDVQVELERPGADFPAIVSAPIFAVVPPAVWRDGRDAFGPDQPVSGGYEVASVSSNEIVLQRNERYWAGPPAIPTVRLVLDIGGRSPVAAFESDDIDYTSVSSVDAPWIPYDPGLGPDLRETSSLDLTYLALDTTRAPFDDVRVRQAFGAAVDWQRVVTLSSTGGIVAARSMVPPGIPGGGDRSWLPAHDPEHARELLAEAGYPGGAGLPQIEFGTGGYPVAAAIAADLQRELGMHVEQVVYDDHLGRISTAPPNFWITGWIADYVGPNDFLGVLLESDSNDNNGRWSSAAFDQAVADALSSRDPAAAQAAYERALGEIQDEVPVVPLYHSTSWSLARDGLLGAGDNGLGILRMAGMAWAE
ncbi:MAG TPA: peptide ABC transporter substrate-binding protein [Candidatus Limnocylindrales bacterium]|nr:peptide ABC transporter substrate-binding protein [Candidatus Limnocylindrales bacterium]